MLPIVCALLDQAARALWSGRAAQPEPVFGQQPAPVALG